jgi:hypothetical protein
MGFFGNHFKFFIANDACPVDLCYTDQSPWTVTIHTRKTS